MIGQFLAAYDLRLYCRTGLIDFQYWQLIFTLKTYVYFL